MRGARLDNAPYHIPPALKYQSICGMCAAAQTYRKLCPRPQHNPVTFPDLSYQVIVLFQNDAVRLKVLPR
jgi:hypothetical protein